MSAAALVGGFAPAAEANEERDSSWSFGAGIGNLMGAQAYRVEEMGSNIVLVPADGGAGTPLAFSVERRLTRNLWLTLRGEWRSSSAESVPHDEISMIDATHWETRTRSSETDSSGWGAALGARYVVNPGSVVEFGPFLAVGVTGGSIATSVTEARSSNLPNSTAMSYTNEATTTDFGPTGGVGFTVEAFLARNISLRLSSVLVSVSHSSRESDSSYSQTPAPPPPTNPTPGPVEPTKNTASSTDFGVTLSPTIELRIAL